MSTEYLTNDTDLKSVADAIRAKTGKTDPLTFPAEFASEIAGIEAGGGTDLSLDITGAAVGQIAKITTVDENGVPTAWIPVDMPSGATDEQISAAVSEWLDDHPEATTTVQDGSVTPAKTSFLEQETESIIATGEYKKTFQYAIKNDGTYHIHAWNKNYNFKADVAGLSKIIISATAAYINYLFFADAPTGATGQEVVGYGGTFAGSMNSGNTDANAPTAQAVTIDVPDGAGWLMVDFGYTQPTDLAIVKPLEKWKFGGQIDKTVNGADISDETIGTQKLEDKAVTAEKLANKSVSTDKLAGYEVTCREVPWEVFLDGYNTKYSTAAEDPDSAVYVVKLEAGKTYALLGIPYPQNNAEFVGNTPNVSNAGYYFAYEELPDVESNRTNNQPLLKGYVSTGIINTIGKYAIDNGYMQPNAGKSATAQGYTMPWYVTVKKDFYIMRASLKPPVGKRVNNAILYEVDSADYTEIGLDGSGTYKMDLGNRYASNNGYTAQILSSKTANADDARSYAAMTRDVPRDRSLSIQFIGDSITYAASNVGLQHAFRKYVPMDFQAESRTVCQSGVSVTTGSGSFDWNGKQNTSEDYDANASGYAGLAQKLAPYKTTLGLKVWADAVDIVVVELGTNDHWEQATLGVPTDLSEDTNFYGAVEKTLLLLEDTFPNAQILWMLPFKNQKWKTSTTKMTSYLIALKIICQTHKRCWVLDLFDKWFVNYDDTDIKSVFFRDSVHITGEAHKCVAESIVEKIRYIISVCGLRRIETSHITDGNDSVYGVPCTGVALSESELIFTGGGSQTLTVTLTPENTTQPIIWKTDSASIAKVNNGVVTAVGNGTTTITVTCGGQSATCTVTVTDVEATA